MADEGFKRRLAAILSADVEGHNRLMDDDEEAILPAGQGESSDTRMERAKPALSF